MSILMLIAIYGILGEMTTPGAILPGVVGAIALILALYLAAILPVNALHLVAPARVWPEIHDELSSENFARPRPDPTQRRRRACSARRHRESQNDRRQK